METKNLKTQTNFAKIVKKHVSRINLLISLGKIETVEIDGLRFVIDNDSNRMACKGFIKE